MGMGYRCTRLATGALLVYIGAAYPSVASALDTSAEESACSELGFKKKTPAFANCVLELYGRKKQHAPTEEPTTAQEAQIATEPPPAGEPQQNIATAQGTQTATAPPSAAEPQQNIVAAQEDKTALPAPPAKPDKHVVSFEEAAEGAVSILFELAKFGLFW
jgi:hypothetical protein